MTRKGKPTSGWVIIAASAVTDDDTLRLWVERGRDFLAAQNPK